MNQFGRLLRTIIIIWVLWWVWFFIYWQKQDVQIDNVQKIYDYYLSSWYDNKREYEKDIEQLSREKQALLDTLNYKETILFYKDGSYSDTIKEWTRNRFLMIDEAITTARERVKELKTPDYADIQPSKAKSTWLDFINLLK